MAKYRVQLNKWDAELVIEASSELEALGLYKAKMGITSSKAERPAILEEIQTKPKGLNKQDLVQEAMSLGIDGAAKMTVEQLKTALAEKKKPPAIEEKKEAGDADGS